MTPSSIDLSVVVPTVDRPSLLGRAVRSCFAGSVWPKEVIVVHDAPALVERYADVYDALGAFPVVRVAHQANKGPSETRNTGWRRARAGWVYFLDDDDYVLPEGIATIARSLDARDRDVEVLAFGSRVHRGSGFQDELPGAIMEKYGIPFWAELGTLVVARRCLEEVSGFDPQIRLGENRDLMARLAARFRVEHVDEPIVCLDYNHSDPRQSQIEGAVEANVHLLRKNEAIYRSNPLWWRSAHLYPACHAARRGEIGTSIKLYGQWARSSGRPIDPRFAGAVASSALARLREVVRARSRQLR
jgi:glycosyltransferase involved in cell wall biosynthesis